MPVAEAENTRIAATAAPQKPNPRNNPVMFKIFQNVQFNVVQHKKYVKEMIKLYKKIDEDSFRESFKNALLYLFTFGDTSANVDRVVQYVATFCTSLDDEEEFLLFIFEIIFECQCVSGQSVRYRASQLLAAVLSALGEDASLDDDLCDKLLASQMQRLQDTRGAVRCRAALALQRLQNPSEPDDDVTRAYRFHMSCDPSSSVRRAIVMSIAKSTRNVPFVLERLCDIDEAVRRAAFLHISAINVTQLRVRQRVLTLKVGLTERSQRVRRVVEEILIPGWLSTFQGNIVDLLKAIRLDNVNDAKDSQYVAGKLLESLFKRLPISELLEWLPTDKSLRLIPAEKLNKETSWYWRHLAEHLQKIGDDDTLETILPDLIVLTGYIRAIIESPCPSETEDPVGFSTRQYVLHELCRMLRAYDATDPSSRAALHQLLTDVLTGDYGPLSSDVIRACVSALELVLPDVTARIEVISGVISALRDPPEPEVPTPPPPPVADSAEVKLKRARLRVSLNVAMEAQEEAVREQNYALAAECKAKVEEIQKNIEDLAPPAVVVAPPPITTIREKLSDIATLDKCLSILNCALDTPQLTALTSNLRNMFSELEVEIFQNPDIIMNALQTVALYGMLDKEFAKENKSFFFANLVDTSNEAVVCTVLRCLVDLLCVHGALVFEQDEETQNNTTKNTTKTTVMDDDGSMSESGLALSPTHSTVIELLLKIMDSPCAAYRLIIVEGLCRLLHLGHLESPSILSRLLLLWFNPATVDEDMLRQIIGVFFQTFPVSVDEAQEQIQKATIPALRTLANAPSSSPLSEIDQESVVRFIVSLTRVNHDLLDSQGGMAAALCQHIARRPASSEVGLACRMLALLSPPRDASLASSLAATLRDLCLKLPDKQSCRNLTKYLGALEAFERASMNKMSHTGITEGTLQEDSLAPLGRTTSSLPQPIARSTHVVINETVEEEVEIDESSPTEQTAISRISAEAPSEIANPSPQSARLSSEMVNPSPQSARSSSEMVNPSPQPARSSSEVANPSPPSARSSDTYATAPEEGSDSSGVSPVKRPKVTKGKKKLSLTKQPNADSKTKSKDKETAKEKDSKSKQTQEEAGGVKRSRSQRSLVDIERAQKAKSEAKSKKSPPSKEVPSSPLSSPDFDSSNVTVRRSTRRSQGSGSEGSGREVEVKGKVKKAPAQKGKPKKSPPQLSSPLSSPDFDSSNVTVRRSTRRSQGSGSEGSGREVEVKGKGKKAPVKKPAKKAEPIVRQASTSSPGIPSLDDSDDASLHTIVYDNEMQQSLLNDSSELADSKRVSKGNITIPESPEASDESESEPEPVPAPKPKGKRNGKKK